MLVNNSYSYKCVIALVKFIKEFTNTQSQGCLIDIVFTYFYLSLSINEYKELSHCPQPQIIKLGDVDQLLPVASGTDDPLFSHFIFQRFEADPRENIISRSCVFRWDRVFVFPHPQEHVYNARGSSSPIPPFFPPSRFHLSAYG